MRVRDACTRERLFVAVWACDRARHPSLLSRLTHRPRPTRPFQFPLKQFQLSRERPSYGEAAQDECPEMIETQLIQDFRKHAADTARIGKQKRLQQIRTGG